MISPIFATVVVATTYESATNTTITTNETHGVTLLMFIDAMICTTGLVLAFIFFESKPLTPPSRSAHAKLISNQFRGNNYNKKNNNNTNNNNYTNNSIINDNENNKNHNYDTEINNPIVNITIVEVNNKNENNINKDDLMIKEIEIEENKRPSIFDEGLEFDGNDISFVINECKTLLKNNDYILLVTASSIYLGMFNGISIMMDQIISQAKYSNSDVGWVGTIYCIGIIGSIIAGKIMDSTHAYRSVLKIGFILSSLSIIYFYSMLYPNNLILLLLGAAFLGLFQLPMLPAIVENLAECTFPIQEDISLGILWIITNLISIPITFLFELFLNLPEFGPAPFNPSDFLGIFLVIIPTIMLLFYNGEYKRLNCDNSHNKHNNSVSHYKAENETVIL